jgi:hypothetical protein
MAAPTSLQREISLANQEPSTLALGGKSPICSFAYAKRTNGSDSGSIRDWFDSSSPLKTTTHSNAHRNFPDLGE